MRIARTAAALLVLALAGCGGPLILRFQGGDKLNFNDKTPPESLPVVVKVFLLKDKASFEAASVEQLWTKDKYKAVLGGDLVGEPREIPVFATKADKLDLGAVPAEVRFIGVLAMYQKKTDPPSKRHAAVPKDDADDYVFHLDEYRLEPKK